MKTKLNLVLVIAIIALSNGFSQDKKPFIIKQNEDKDNVIMTWNATTPETEMNDDIKALADYGVSITYSDVKRNSKGEITTIKVTYADRKGNKGCLDMNNQKPINTIKFFKQGESIGFGEPASNDFTLSTNGFNGFSNGHNPMQLFNFSPGGTDENSKSYSYSFSDDNSSAKSRTFIHKDGKKTLVIEDSKVVQGGEDYTKEEIDEFIKNNNENILGNGEFKSFNFKGDQDFSEEIRKMQEQLDELRERQNKTESKEKEKANKEDEEKTKTTLKLKKA
jgi:hypothetical protein